ncbi:hypothetical protein BH10PSE14_BH10PSE14_04260 [soil metagenome]
MRAPTFSITAYRKDPLQQPIVFTGVDLTGVDISFAVKLGPDVAGDPIIHLTTAVDGGITLFDVSTDGDGIATSVILLSMAKAAHVAALDAYQPVEPGLTVILYFDMQWTPPAELVAPLTPVETTILTGNYFVVGSAND